MAAAPGAEIVLKDEPWTRVVRRPLCGLDVVHKTYLVPPWTRWRTFLLTSRAGREYRNLSRIHASGVPCVRPLGFAEERRLGVVRRSALLTEFAPGTRSWKQELLDRPSGDRRHAHARRVLAATFGALLRRLHQAGFLGARISPRNVLVRWQDPDRAEACAMLLCDLPAASGFSASILDRPTAGIDLFDAAFSPGRRAQLTAAERFRLVLAYAAGDRNRARQLWRWLARRSKRGNELRKALRTTLDSYLGLLAQCLRRGRLHLPPTRVPELGCAGDLLP